MISVLEESLNHRQKHSAEFVRFCQVYYILLSCVTITFIIVLYYVLIYSAANLLVCL